MQFGIKIFAVDWILFGFHFFFFFSLLNAIFFFFRFFFFFCPKKRRKMQRCANRLNCYFISLGTLNWISILKAALKWRTKERQIFFSSVFSWLKRKSLRKRKLDCMSNSGWCFGVSFSFFFFLLSFELNAIHFREYYFILNLLLLLFVCRYFFLSFDFHSLCKFARFSRKKT